MLANVQDPLVVQSVPPPVNVPLVRRLVGPLGTSATVIDALMLDATVQVVMPVLPATNLSPVAIASVPPLPDMVNVEKRPTSDVRFAFIHDVASILELMSPEMMLTIRQSGSVVVIDGHDPDVLAAAFCDVVGVAFQGLPEATQPWKVVMIPPT